MNELRLNNFLGIDFGVSPQSAKKKLLSRTGCIYDQENSTDDVLYFNGLTSDGLNKALIILFFENEKFCKSTMQIKPKNNTSVIQDYKKIKRELNSKYFITNNCLETYEKPYEENDGYTETGISLGKVIYKSHWSFPRAKGLSEDSVSLKISNDFTIIVNYEYRGILDINPRFQDSNAQTACYFLITFILILYLFTM
ncbi:MAG TPA: hypothetical protein VIV55_11555 [Flavobacterium sp.]